MTKEEIQQLDDLIYKHPLKDILREMSKIVKEKSLIFAKFQLPRSVRLWERNAYILNDITQFIK